VHGEKVECQLPTFMGLACCQQAIVTYLDEARGKHVLDESSKELHRVECCGVPITSAERDPSVIDGYQTVIRDGHPVGILSQVLHDLFGSAKGTFAVNHPLHPAEFSHKLSKGDWVKPWFSTRSLETSLGESVAKAMEELAPKKLPHDAHGKEKVRASRYP